MHKNRIVCVCVNYVCICTLYNNNVHTPNIAGIITHVWSGKSVEVHNACQQIQSKAACKHEYDKLNKLWN